MLPSRRFLRLFIALWPDRAGVTSLAGWMRTARWPSGAAIVPPAQWHLTLHFIGAVAAPLVPSLAPLLRVPVTPFDILFGRLAAWPHGLLALEPLEVPPPLLDLHAALAGRLGAAGLPVEARPFRPHVTLARKAAGVVLPVQPLPPLRWHVHEVALVESDHGYRTIARWH